MTGGTDEDAIEENRQGSHAAVNSALEAAGETAPSLEAVETSKNKQDSKQDGADTLEANASALKNFSGP